MKKFLAVVLVLIPCVAVLLAPLGASAFFFSPGGSGGGGTGTTNASDLSSGVVATARGGTAIDTSASTGHPYVLSGTWSIKTLSQILTLLGLSSTDNVTFNTVTASEFVSSATDNTRGVTVPNTADPTGADLAAGKMWVTDNSVKVRSNDNTVTFIAGSMTKPYSFGIDNVADSDDVFIWMDLPRAITITKVTCFASVDNVVGSLTECTAADVTSCTAVDSTDFTIGGATLQTTATSFTTGFENAGIAAGAHLKWLTTSAPATSNKLSCTIQYRE